MTAEPSALLDIQGAIATVTFNRPQAYNSIGLDEAKHLAALAPRITENPDIRVVVLRGNGPAFCAGGDIRCFVAHIDNIEPMVRELLQALHVFLMALRDGPRIVLTSVHGAAAGAGFSIAALGDICIAADNARFTTAYNKLGVTPDGGGSIGIVERVGPRKALELFLATDSLTAQHALELGLVNQVVPADQLEAATADMAARLARNTPDAIRLTKQLVQQSSRTPAAAQLDAELEAMAHCMQTPAFREAISRFVKK